MLIREIMEASGEEIAKNAQVVAVAQLIADRTEDADSESKMSTSAFVAILNDMGLPFSIESLMDLVQMGTLSAVISDVNQDEIFFKGQNEIEPEAMDVDTAHDVVNDMAKRNMNKGGLGSGPADNGVDDLPEYN